MVDGRQVSIDRRVFFLYNENEKIAEYILITEFKKEVLKIKKVTFGTPEISVPSKYCKKFNYTETEISYPLSRFTAKRTARGFLLEFPIENDANIYGFGLQLKQFDHRGRKLRLAVNADPVTANGDSHAPVPFFVTNKGYGMYFDTARYIEVYCGYKKTDASVYSDGTSPVVTDTAELYAVRKNTDAVMSVLIPAASGVDVYIIEGKNITDITAQYNMLSGGGPDVPEWALGVLYRCGAKLNRDEVLSTAEYFRKNDIPCDILGLEPGWQTHTYPCSYVFGERFPRPKEMIDKLRADGFHINLWEHAFCHRLSPIYSAYGSAHGDYGVWDGIVPDFALSEARKAFADYHREYLVSMGVDGFKLDECDSSDNTGGWSFPLISQFPSGLDGEQYHSLFGTLYCQAVGQALGDTKTLSEVRSLGALAASYPFVLYSDLYDHRDFVRGVVQSGFSGLLWTPEVRECGSKNEMLRRLQTVVFSAQCLINAWQTDRVPWLDLGCTEEVRELLKLRKRLVPMLKKSFDIYRDTGKPPVRALVSDYTDDPATFGIDDEYMFCEDLLVAPVFEGESDERKVYLPVADHWTDFFTGESVGSGEITVKTANIPVFKRT